MNSHTIIYLDQMYLSNMAKAMLGLMKNKDNPEFWKPLFNGLKAAVMTNKIACPESEFQRKEASLDRRIERTVGKILDELSWGLQFNYWEDILIQQIEDAAFRFSRKCPPPSEPWAIAFNSDPQAPVESRMDDIYGVKGRISISYPLSDEITDEVRNNKQAFVKEGLEMLRKYSIKPLQWPKLLIQSKKGVVDGFIGQQANQEIIRQAQENSPSSQLKALNKLKELEDIWKRLQRAGINTNDTKAIMPFAESDKLLNSPFIDINGSIWAVIGQCFINQGRELDKGDFYDVPILASVLPYCDIVTTDSFMKEILVNKLHFDKNYNCKILSPSETDRQTFYNLITKS